MALVSDAAMDALARRYARWAVARGLGKTAEEKHRFEGRIVARDVVFRTGLGGSAPHPPDIVVLVALGIEESVLLTRHSTTASSDTANVLREVLGANDDIRNIGVTPSLVRITFEPGAEDEAFDAALEALEERLRLLTNGAKLPYRG